MLRRWILAALVLASPAVAAVTQVTNDTTGHNGPYYLRISHDGNRIAFLGLNRDYTGGNPDTSYEVFIYDIGANTFTQVGNDLDIAAAEMSFDGDGSRLVFDSAGNLTGSNADGNVELFLFDTTTGLAQLTATTGVTSHPFNRPTINQAGTRVAFVSDHNLTGGNADGNLELFTHDIGTPSFVQVTSSSACSTTRVASNAVGTRFAFNSTCDLVGTNADGNFEIFLYDVGSPGVVTQVTQTASSKQNDFQLDRALDDDGTHVLFDSTADFAGENSDGNSEVFVYDTMTSQFRQLTHTTGNAYMTSFGISGDGGKALVLTQNGLAGTGCGVGVYNWFVIDVATAVARQLTFATGNYATGGTNLSGDGSRFAILANFDFTGQNTEHLTELYRVDAGPPSVDLKITKTDMPDPVSIHQNLFYSIMVQNQSTEVATSLQVVDTLSPAVQFVSVNPASGCSTLSGTVTCNRAALCPKASYGLTVTVSPNVPAMITNTVTVTGAEADPNLADNTAQTVTLVHGTIIPTTSTSTTAVPSTVTTTTDTLPLATTTTTLPPGCEVAATFASIKCRLAALAKEIDESADLGKLKGNLRSQVGRASSKIGTAELRVGQSKRVGKAAVKAASSALRSFGQKVRSLTARKTIKDAARRKHFDDAAKAIRADIQQMLSAL